MRPGTSRSARMLSLAVAVLMSVCLPAPAADWPHWRGPDYSGISKETGWSGAWPAGGPKVLWRANVGTGYSSFAVAGGRAYTMGNQGNQDSVYCFDAATGKEIWKHTYPCPLDPRFHDGGCNATPTVDGGLVYTISKRGHIFCLDAATGKVKWSRTLRTPPPTWGYAGSGLIHGNLVVFNCGTAGLALDKITGALKWENGRDKSGYSTPVPLKMQGRACLALFLKDSVGVVQAGNGQRLWSHPWKTRYDVNAADPIVRANRMFISSGYDRGCALLEFAYGKANVVWENRRMRNHFNSCVLVDDHLYGFDEETLTCLSWTSGRARWTRGGLGKGALMAADGKLLLMADDPKGSRGMLKIAQATPDGYKELASAKVLSGKSRCWTTPVLSGGRIFVRDTKGDVACVDVKGK